MNLSEKIMKHRKKKGWSKEELSEQLNISRQSVSKWESGASVPDLDKILRLSEIFKVSTDYLLKDEIEEEKKKEEPEPRGWKTKPAEKEREISGEEAADYIKITVQAAWKIAAGAAVCILSPVFLILFAGMAENHAISVAEDTAGGNRNRSASFYDHWRCGYFHHGRNEAGEIRVYRKRIDCYEG